MVSSRCRLSIPDFAVAQMDDCGLPDWLVSQSSWTNLDGRVKLTMTPGSNNRSFKMTLMTEGPPRFPRKMGRRFRNQDLRGNFRHLEAAAGDAVAVDDLVFDANNNDLKEQPPLQGITSHLKCHKLIREESDGKVSSSPTSFNQRMKIVAYQKVEW